MNKSCWHLFQQQFVKPNFIFISVFADMPQIHFFLNTDMSLTLTVNIYIILVIGFGLHLFVKVTICC